MELKDLAGKLVCLEGQDFSGKSTLAKMLNQKLNEEGVRSIYSYEPGDWGELGASFRDYCKNKSYDFTDLSILFLFYIDRQQHIKNVILPSLQNNVAVIEDRYVASSQAYQFGGKQLKEKYHLSSDMMDWLLDISAMDETGEIIEPDYMFLIKRAKKEQRNDETDRFETAGKDFYDRVSKEYETIFSSNTNKFVIEIEEGETEKESLQKILECIEKL